MKPQETLTSTLSSMTKLPSVVLKEYFDTLNTYPPSESELNKLSKLVMLPAEEVKIWLDHLHTVCTNRRKGAVKAAETRRRKKQKPAMSVPDPIDEAKESEYQYGICHTPYQAFTQAEEKWIAAVMHGIILLVRESASLTYLISTNAQIV